MFSKYNQRSRKTYMNYYKQPEPVKTHTSSPTEIVSIPEEQPKKTLERMNNPNPEDRLEKDAKMIEEKEPIEIEPKKEEKIVEHQMLNSFETLKNRFLNVKNKSLFIKRNKDKIKSLVQDEQRQFIQIAKSHFENM
jgi:hypothetical protein